ncbi:syntaxin-18 isoform X1 [Takifugu flavidus]|uniref:Syntaxin-18 n=1 Tax=Takifugu flavidus TaxID=433684 RepID=A0A5C6N3C2_9TELE|nr:syntaxin-18 isoform X1 [Takifugu flavidus]TWW61693.1 Syntaxin-18 Cell growth-inhibiting gene 9 protein [Takifugu flavidus]
MAVDITLLFKASVKTVKTRNKAIGIGFDSPKDEIFKRNRPKGGFSPRAKEVVTNITKLKDFLLQHRKDYVSAGSLISSDLTCMTDSERDQIDQDAQIFMRTCSEAIRQLRNEAEKQLVPAQIKEHRGVVLDLIEMYLKGVCKLYSEQRAIRVKRMVDKKRMSRMTPEQHNLVAKTPPSVTSEEKSIKEETPEKSVSEVQDVTWTDPVDPVEDKLSPEEIQMFEQENQRLESEMNNLVDEVRQIEGKVVEISRLQEIFTEKVLQQEAEIDGIHQLVVGATENVKEGNEDIREAIKNNAGFRVWILFFLVMCSFSLLFLDWYDS